MAYRIRNTETNEIISNEGLLLSPEDILYQNNEKVSFPYEIQRPLHAKDIHGKQIFEGDAFIVKQERLPHPTDKIYLLGLEHFTTPYDFDELVFQTEQDKYGHFLYWIFFKKNGEFLKNKEMGFTSLEEHGAEPEELRAIPMSDMHLIRKFANQKNAEIIYNMTDTTKWVNPW